jgi:hypothetical protein
VRWCRRALFEAVARFAGSALTTVARTRQRGGADGEAQGKQAQEDTWKRNVPTRAASAACEAIRGVECRSTARCGFPSLARIEVALSGASVTVTRSASEGKPRSGANRHLTPPTGSAETVPRLPPRLRLHGSPGTYRPCASSSARPCWRIRATVTAPIRQGATSQPALRVSLRHAKARVRAIYGSWKSDWLFTIAQSSGKV